MINHQSINNSINQSAKGTSRWTNCNVMVFFIIITRWMFPFIGHMGIAMSSGVIRDFAGPYFVSVSKINKNAII